MWNGHVAFEVCNEVFDNVANGVCIDGLILGSFPFEVDDKGQDRVVDLVLYLTDGEDKIGKFFFQVGCDNVANLIEVDGCNPCFSLIRNHGAILKYRKLKNKNGRGGGVYGCLGSSVSRPSPQWLGFFGGLESVDDFDEALGGIILVIEERGFTVCIHHFVWFVIPRVDTEAANEVST